MEKLLKDLETEITAVQKLTSAVIKEMKQTTDQDMYYTLQQIYSHASEAVKELMFASALLKDVKTQDGEVVKILND